MGKLIEDTSYYSLMMHCISSKENRLESKRKN